jgi:DNA uptake protein ComE-like DNA-binding protein
MSSSLLRRPIQWLVLAMLAVAVSACSAPAASSPAITAAPNMTPTPAAKLNLNTATSDQLLATIPGFGNRMVREFQEYRPYTSILQFRREIGKYVDDAQVAEYEKYVYVPIAINDADAATLQQIPGLDSTEADALITARPYASNDAFLEKLATYVSAEEVAIAKRYLQ